MKALSIRQPWAWLITNGYKDVENRVWSTNFRGIFQIHAGKVFDDSALDFIRSILPDKWTFNKMINESRLQTGGIVGAAEIIDCVQSYDSPWFFGPFGFVIRNPEIFEFKPMSGKLKFFEV